MDQPSANDGVPSPKIASTTQTEGAQAANSPPEDKETLMATIRQQVEYYFSDENLPRDAFILKQMKMDATKEGNVALKVIAAFPKMKKLTRDANLIRESLSKSETLVLTNNGQYVKRKVPYALEDTTEKRTLYATRLPKDCDKESLKLVFSECGKVMRLDLPMDKKTGEIKGMAFVEYETEKQLKKALREFSNPNNKYKMVVKPFRSSKLGEEANGDNANGDGNSNGHSIDGNGGGSPGKDAPKGKQKERVNDGNQLEKKGREVPSVPDSVYDSLFSTRARKNSKEASPLDWEPDPAKSGARPKLYHLKGQAEATIVPLRNPLSPDGSKGFTAGRGKLVK